MKNKEQSSISALSINNLPRIRRPFIHRQENKIPVLSNLLLNNSNDSIVNKENNEDDDENFDNENIFENPFGDHHLLTPINESHRFLSNKNRFGKAYINSKPLKKILVPKSRSKSPTIRNFGNIRNKNEFKMIDNLKKNATERNEIFSTNRDFLHCRNCMLVIALNRYGKYYFNK
jgi:hypothetical protein